MKQLCMIFFVLIVPSLISVTVESKCTKGCDTALASYYVWIGSNLTFIAQTLRSSLVDPNDVELTTILSYNKQLSNKDSLLADTRINVPFPCDCINGEFLGHTFQFSINSGDTYEKVATRYYSNLTDAASLQRINNYPPTRIPDRGTLNVTVNCSCGDADVSKQYRLFVTYPLRPGDSLQSIARNVGLSESLLQNYNPGVNFTRGSGLVFIPGRDANGVFPALESSSTGIAGGAIAGISIAGVAGLALLAVCVYVGFYRKKKVKRAALLSATSQDLSAQSGSGTLSFSASYKTVESTGPAAGTPTSLNAITVDKSVEFSYEELSKATDNFSMSHKIGQGGFGAVYYAELRGEKAAIKKMDMQASREFLAELKVLTHVHHLNLVRLIGYCVEGSLFLVYEYIENGNLSEHLRGSGRDPLPWSSRVQIALDSARGLEYIHEHTVPVYIHRDIKSANILIDKNFHAKVADFGLTKLTEVGSASLPTRLVGTFGYMPPEYAQYGDVSPKVDVYAFGVVLYELISAKEAIVKGNGSSADSKGLVALFEEVLNLPDPIEDLRKLVDPRLGDNCPLDSVLKMAQLAKVCTQEYPQLRPSMRSIVVALMTLSSTTEDWDVGSFYENHALVNLMSGSWHRLSKFKDENLLIVVTSTACSSMEEAHQEEALISHLLQDLFVNEKAGDESESESLPNANNLDEVEEILGYRFNNKNLLEEAFTDPSCPERFFSYERLEYVGDSVLNLLLTKEQFFLYPNLPPGSLTRLRSANVNTEKLARVAIKLGLHKYLRHNKPLLEEQIREFSEAILDYPLHSNGLVDAPKVLADIVESTIGAVFIDCNSSIDIVWKVFKELLKPMISPETLKTHPVTELYEVCQKNKLKVKFVDLWKESTAFHIFIEDQLLGRGAYAPKKEIAHNRAAKDALNNIERLLNEKR
ncbi:Chitin elicitor receptor kinase 1 [Citrus sinensis]|uniref:Chitin elicitor receptor kinase 1 n=1 Tax=Citrus sinensis TaxID=2711 RepID=A0ACB8N5X7_CITSI|nr:Chitin elicitor receptor kinase 1 [Citrus sinensis]